MSFDDPQAAEDAYYDAIDSCDLDALMQVWDEQNAACFLPMQPLLEGREAIREAWAPLLSGEIRLDIRVRHLQWIETDGLAIHLLEEQVRVPGAPPQSVYASNVYRRGPDGWRLVLHQNSPTPPPAGMVPPHRP